MSSQTQEHRTPTCKEGHGYMLPVNWEYAWLNEQGQVVAMIEWVSREGQPIKPYVYAVDETTFDQVPPVEQAGDWAHHLMQSGRLVLFREVARAQQGIYRVDDDRERHQHSYRVIGDQLYYFFSDEAVHLEPRCTTVAEVEELVSSLDGKIVVSYESEI